ncbi:MAG: ABC transporter permease subunit [Candidatus Lokiarchaeota archaeon]|nr:ABC transporter permease subunit [Candidatus Lokiarchaeota archaeon]
MEKINVIIRKEWAEVFKNKMVIFTVAFLPLIMTAIPLIILYSTGETGMGDDLSSDVGQMVSSGLCLSDLNNSECFQVYLVSQFMMLFMLIPLAIPITIAAYSIVGEKNARSLEPLLATPITTFELLIGKSLAAVIPAILATYGSFIIFITGVSLLIKSKAVLMAFLDLRWLVAIFIVGPLMAVLAVNLSLMVSSRVNDPRAAEQISMILIVPVLGLFFGQMAGLFILNRQVITIIAIILLAIDFLIVYLAIQVFDREAILTRWR